MTDKRTSDAPLYRAEGLQVVKRPVVNPAGGTTMGFRVCTVNEYVDGAAEVIADALNRLPELEAALQAIKPHIGPNGGYTGSPRGDDLAALRRGLELVDG